MARAQHRGGIFWPPSTPAVTGPIAARKLRSYAIYYDLFDETLTAGNVDGTDSTDENALREVYDTGNQLELTEFLLMDYTGASDPSLWHTTLTPGPWEMWNGFAVFWQSTHSGITGGYTLGLDVDLTQGIAAPHIQVSNEFVYVGSTGPFYQVFAASQVQFMIVRRNDSAGYYYFRRLADSDQPWKLFWMDEGPLISA